VQARHILPVVLAFACGEPRRPVTLALGVLAANHRQTRAAQLPPRIDDRVVAGMRVIV
jgi:hypothetical protein